MKVTANTPDRLEITDHPWFLWLTLTALSVPMLYATITGSVDGILIRLFVGGMGLGALWLMHHFAPIQRFTFDRATGLMTHEVTRINGRRVWESPLSDIKRAVPEGEGRDDGLKRVTLVMETGPYPMESGYTARPAEPIVNAINRWLHLSG